MQRSEHYDKIILFRLPNTAESRRPVPNGSKYKYNYKFSFKCKYKSNAACNAEHANLKRSIPMSAYGLQMRIEAFSAKRRSCSITEQKRSFFICTYNYCRYGGLIKALKDLPIVFAPNKKEKC